MKSEHDMPFGAEVRRDGTVRFRLWAPDCSSVGLAFEGQSDELAMQAIGEGWFEFISDHVRPGTRYRFNIPGKMPVPDPASRFQPSGVHSFSEVIDPRSYRWRDAEWTGRPWNEAVIYELHVGTFTPEGTFASAETKLDYLADLGVTAVELMPVSSFPGCRNWGYDGVLPFAPASSYGKPDDLKHLVDAAHRRNLMVFLDVVYNHFGPEGNYLPLYASQFFTNRHHTPWGQAINFDGPCSRVVRDYFIHNALYWLEEYHFDGLRFDAAHAIIDGSPVHIVTELATTIRQRFAKQRHIHLLLENADNTSRYLREQGAQKECVHTAQWDDDIHHALHVALTGESDGYYSDYAENPAWHLGRCLAEGFSFQGEPSPYHGGVLRGEPSRDLPPGCFVFFLQNHDQIGNRAFGDRITSLASTDAVKAAMTCVLLAPSPPLLFMGEEFAASTPFLFFCDFGPDLASAVTQGRRSEFKRFAQFNSLEAQARIPDPNSEQTFLSCKLDWSSVQRAPHKEWLDFYRNLLACRQREVVPMISRVIPGHSKFEVLREKAVRVEWRLAPKGKLTLLTNLSEEEICITEKPQGRLLHESKQFSIVENRLSPFSAAWFLDE
jgi:maltooligosyltrehalose trehalohydrolase